MKWLMILLISCSLTDARAAATLKYTGEMETIAGAPHNDGVKGQVKVFFDEMSFTQLVLTTTKPVFGKTEFPSTEQKAFFREASGVTQLALVFKLKGPPHKWYYVYMGETSDQGATYAGKILKAPNTMDQIGESLAAGNIPQAWSNEGSMSLKQTAP
ncbi:MAG TPA: hypothetical protein VFV50_00635 [Bdellovibrionales bacterium]|nr:hypothetical protein [Bdellovibrionales bacterium]